MKKYNVIVIFDKDMKKILMCKRTKLILKTYEKYI